MIFSKCVSVSLRCFSCFGWNSNVIAAAPAAALMVMVAAAECVWLLLWMLDSVISFVKFPVM